MHMPGVSLPSKSELSRCLLINSYIRIFHRDTITNNENGVGTANLLNIPLYNDVAVFLIKFYCEANPVGLLAGDEGGPAAAEGVEHDAVCEATMQRRLRSSRFISAQMGRMYER